MSYINRDGDGWGEPQYEDAYTENMEAARTSWGGWLFTASLVLGGIFALFGQSPVDKGETYADATTGIIILATAIIAAAFTWRVHIGKGWIAGGVLLIWWAVEVVGKLTGGTLNIGWAIFHIAGMANLFLGVKACWLLRGEIPPAIDEAVAVNPVAEHLGDA